MVRSPFSGYGPGNQRMISMILRGIAELGDDQIIDALRKTPRAVRASSTSAMGITSSRCRPSTST
jgi:hypothetical protein